MLAAGERILMATSTTPKSASSTGYVLMGAILVVIGAVVMYSAATNPPHADESGSWLIGVLVGAVGGSILLVGLVAKGVALGVDEHRRSL